MTAHLENPSKTPSRLSLRDHYRLGGPLACWRSVCAPFGNHLFLERLPLGYEPALRRTLTKRNAMRFVEHWPTAGIMGRTPPGLPHRLTIRLIPRLKSAPWATGARPAANNRMAEPSSCALPGQRATRCGCAPHHFDRYVPRPLGASHARHGGQAQDDAIPRIDATPPPPPVARRRGHVGGPHADQPE